MFWFFFSTFASNRLWGRYEGSWRQSLCTTLVMSSGGGGGRTLTFRIFCSIKKKKKKHPHPPSLIWQAGVGQGQSDPLWNCCLDILWFGTILVFSLFLGTLWEERVSEGRCCRIWFICSFTSRPNEPDGRKWAQNVKCHFVQELTCCDWSPVVFLLSQQLKLFGKNEMQVLICIMD